MELVAITANISLLSIRKPLSFFVLSNAPPPVNHCIFFFFPFLIFPFSFSVQAFASNPVVLDLSLHAVL